MIGGPISAPELLARLADARYGLFDLLPEGSLVEKLVSLTLAGPPPMPAAFGAELADLAKALNATDTGEVRVVLFGGGTGLSNLIGGDSRSPLWPQSPFSGLKEVFPKTSAVVCVTDDGGSTGELLKDLPLIAIGDIRHVLLSSVRLEKLKKQYGLDERGALRACALLHRLFNHRFSLRPASAKALLAEAGVEPDALPAAMAEMLLSLLEALFVADDLSRQLDRPHCLGNLLLVAAVYRARPAGAVGWKPSGRAVCAGISLLADCLGADPDAVFPCTTTPAQLRILYDNGVLVNGEAKSGNARRGHPMNRVFVEFSDIPELPDGVLSAIAQADLIVFAPGSLFTSIVPILQTPGIAEAIRANQRALKILVANLWVQAGETDSAQSDPQRRFHTSDLLAAYHRNIPGGVVGLFEHILILGLRDIPGSILQKYALEDKSPIYFDRERVEAMGFAPIEARLYSQESIDRLQVIQHDPASLATAVRALWALRNFLPPSGKKHLPGEACRYRLLVNPLGQAPDRWFAEMGRRLDGLLLAEDLRPQLAEIFWRHRDILPSHLDRLCGVTLVGQEHWKRGEEWDSIHSFYDPDDRMINIREDAAADAGRLEAALLVGLGQSLLGNYAAEKRKVPVERDGEMLGYEFRLILRPKPGRDCFFSQTELDRFLGLVRMRRSNTNPLVYTRLINDGEGFTPPGLLFGLTYAWYLDNRLAAHIEYKMSISRMPPQLLTPEQQKVLVRRRALVDFFRTVVFGCTDPQFAG